MSKARITLTVITAVLLAACQSGLDQRYLDTSLGQSLVLPPDLTQSEVESQFELPSAFSGDDPEQRDQVPVLAKVDSVRIRGREEFYWLEVDAPVSDIYAVVKDFWAVEGFRLQIDEPVIGVMQTEWLYTQTGTVNPNAAWWQRWFSDTDLSAVQDQYRTRIERGENGGPNRIYIVHRGTTYQHVLDSKAFDDNQNFVGERDNEWGFRASDPELEVEMLSRLMVYFGLQQSSVDEQLAEVKMFQPRAQMHIDAEVNSPFLIVNDPYEITWNRIIHQLERLNFEIVSSEEKSGVSGEGAITVRAEKVDIVESDGLFSFLGSAEFSEKSIVLVLSEESHKLTRVEIEDDTGEIDTSPEGAEFLDLLYRQVR